MALAYDIDFLKRLPVNKPHIFISFTKEENYFMVDILFIPIIQKRNSYEASHMRSCSNFLETTARVRSIMF